MSWVASRSGGTDAPSVPPDLDSITDEEFLKQLWQQVEDFGDRRRIRARMYKLREKRLREMVQNDEESLGALTMTDEGLGDSNYRSTTNATETHTSDVEESSQRKSSIEIKMDGSSSRIETATTTMTMKGVDSRRDKSDEEIMEDNIREVSKGRGTRYQEVLNKYDQGDSRTGTSRTIYSVQSNALTGDSYQTMKHKEVRDSVSPVRGGFDRKIVGEDSESFLTSDEEITLRSENESVSSRNTSKEEKSSVKGSSRRITERKVSKELDLGSSRRTDKSSPSSPKSQSDASSSSRTVSRRMQKESPLSSGKSTPTRRTPSGSGSRTPVGKKQKMNEIAKKMDLSIKNEYNKLNKYINENIDDTDEIIKEEEEEMEDESGNIVKMIVQTRRKKDGTEIISRRMARTTRVVDKESDIDEILIGNPDHEIVERNVEEKEEKDGSKIKIITETRRRPDGIEYTTKNVLKTSKIFDYDHPEDIAYCENDELISTEEATETDEHGTTIRTVTETRRKKDGVEYTTKKVYKTSKVDETITPSDDDEVLDKQETEEKQSDGTVIKIVIEKRRTKDGQEYTHRQVYRTRKLTLSGIEVLKGTPAVDNDDEVIDRKEKEELDENKAKIRVVTETRRRKDGSTYSFEYVIRSFKTTERDIEKMPMSASNASNINVSNEDEIIKEEVKEDVQKDGTIVRTIIERRRAKDGTEYLRHRIMKIPKLPEPQLVVGSLDDEVIEENVKEKVLEDGTHCKAITERRRSSTTGVQYTLRRMSKIYHHQPHVIQGTDEIIDENVTEEEAGDGVLVKTVIRRYQRPDGNVYTTHDIQKSYRSPVSVNVEDYENDDLIDRSYDERETDDGYIIKTIVETRYRTDGTHYTIERTEKVSKFGDDIQVSFKGNSIGSGSPGDTVISCEEHEEPSDDGTVLKTIMEVRRRTDGTEYTNKITIRSTKVLVPEHETSYVIIKADTNDDDEGKSLFPSLDDEVVYVREKKETDEKGNPITVIIETRKSKQTGEKYNLTKKVHTTDVVITDQGEKVLSRKTQPAERAPRKPKVTEKRDVDIKNKSTTPSKRDTTRPQTTFTSGTTTTTRKLTAEDSASRTTSRTTPIKRNLRPSDKKEPESENDSEPSRVSKEPVKRSPSGDTRPQSRFTRKPATPEPKIQEPRKVKDSPIRKERPSPSTPSSRLGEPKEPKTTRTDRKPLSTKTPDRKPDSSPDQVSENDSSGRETPSRPSKLRPETPKREPDTKTKKPLERVPSSPRRGRSPLRSGTSTPREGTPNRQCCKKSPEQETPISKQRPISTMSRRKPTEDQPKTNGDVRKYPSKYQKQTPKKIEPEKLSKFERPSTLKDSPRRTPNLKSTEKPSTRSVRKPSEKPSEPSKDKVYPDDLPIGDKEPIVTLPQTPLTEEMKAYPATSSPFIEDVSAEPTLPYHTVHRPSLVREPSEYNQPESYDDEPDKKENSKTSPLLDKKVSEKEHPEPKIPEKRKSDSFPSSSSEDESRRYPSVRKDYSPKKLSSPEPEKKPVRDTKVKPVEEVPKSITSQIISDDDKPEPKKKYSKETEPIDSYDTKKSFSARLSMFENASPKPKTREPLGKVQDKETKPEKLVPVKEPVCVRKYVHPLGSDTDEEEPEKKPQKYEPEREIEKKPRYVTKEERTIDKLTNEDVNLSSTRLVMSAIGAETKKRDSSPKEEPTPDDRKPSRREEPSPRDRKPSKKEETSPSDRRPSREEETRPTERKPSRKEETSPTGRKPSRKEDTSPSERKPSRKEETSPIARKPSKKEETTPSDRKPSRKEEDKPEDFDIVSPLKDRSRSPVSKESSPHPRSKESSPAPFVKEDSPGRFLTGRPIDQGPNTSKIKRLERSNSNKKIIYEDLEINAANLPTYLKDIEYITDITVLETLLQKAETYEERRVIRGHIRSLKKTDTGSKPSSPAPYKRFVDSTTPSKPSPTASPILGRRMPAGSTPTVESRFKPSKTTPGETTPKYPSTQDTTTRKSPPKEFSPNRKRSTDDFSPTRKFSDEERKHRPDAFDREPRDLRTTVLESKETFKTFRKISSESSKYRDVSPEEAPKYRRNVSSDEDDKTRKPLNKGYRKESPEDTRRDRLSSPEDVSRRYRRTSPDEVYRNRKSSSDEAPRDKRRPLDDFKRDRKSSGEEVDSYIRTKTSYDTIVTKKTSREETQRYRKSSSEDTEVVRKPSFEDTAKGRKLSPDGKRRPEIPNDDRKTSDTLNKSRKTPEPTSPRKSSRDEVVSPKKTPSRDRFVRKTSRDDLSPDESPKKSSPDRRPSTEDHRPKRKTPEESKPIRKFSDTKPSRKISSEEKTYTNETINVESTVLSTTRDTIRLESTKEPEQPKRFTKRYPVDEPVSKDSRPNEPKGKTEERSSFTTMTRRFDKVSPSSTSVTTTPKTKDRSDSGPFIEPLRHQKSNTKTPIRTPQTHVDKIVSPYGVGPTDENGVPLIGLKALRKRNQQQQPQEQPSVPSEPEQPEEEFVPSDSQGKPLFGIRALRKAPLETTTFTTTQVAKESTSVKETLRNASISTEEDHLKISVATQPRTHTTTVVSSTNEPLSSKREENRLKEAPPSSASPTSSPCSSSDDSQSGEELPSAPKLSDRKQRRTRRKETHASTGMTTMMSPESSDDEGTGGVESELKTRRVRPSRLCSEPSSGQSSESEGAKRAAPVAGETSPSLVRSIDISLRQKSPGTDSENESEKPVSLKDIIKLHESKVVGDAPEATESPSRLKPRKILRETFEATPEQSDSRPHKTWDLETDLTTRSQAIGNIIAKHETLTHQQDTVKSETKLNGILKKTSITSTHSTKITSSESERDESPERSPTLRKVSKDRPDPVDSEDDEPDKPERKTSYTEITLSRPTSKSETQVGKTSAATVHLDSSSTSSVVHRDGGSLSASHPSGLRETSAEGQILSSSEVRKSFLDDRSKVTGISDVLSRMDASPAVDHESKVTSDDQARSLLNKFLGAQVLMTGVESMMANASSSVASSQTSMTRDNEGKTTVTRSAAGQQMTKSMKDGEGVTETKRSFATGPQTISYTSSTTSSPSPKVEGTTDIVKGVNINEVTDDFLLNQLLDSCEEYDERRRVRMRLKALMAEKKALQKQLSGHERSENYSSSSRRIAGVSGSKGSDLRTSEGSSYSFSRGSSSQVTSQKSSFSSSYSTQSSSKSFQSYKDGKSVSAFDKFKQLDSPSSNQSLNAQASPALKSIYLTSADGPQQNIRARE